MKKIFSIVTAAALAAAAMPVPIAALAADETDLFSYKQSFDAYPSDDELTDSSEAGKWNLNGASGITDSGYLPLFSTGTGLYTARYYIDTANNSTYYTDHTTVEFSAEFKVDADAENNGLIGFNFMAAGSTQTELFFLSAKAEDSTAHLYLPKTGAFDRNEYTTDNGYDAGTVEFGEWVKLTVRINNENVSYYVDDSYLTTVSFAGKTPLGNAEIDNISIAARNSIKGGARNFTYRVYSNGKKLEYLPESNFSGSFRMNTTAEVSEGRLVFGNGDILAADRTLASGDMAGTEYNAALSYNTREHIIKLNAAVLDTAAEGDYFDLVNADTISLTSARMRLVRFESNGDGTYKVLINTTASNDEGAAPTQIAAADIRCGTPVNVLVKIEKSTAAADANIITYYINGKAAGSVDRTGGKPSYGVYVKLLANGASDAIASVDDVQAYCYANGVYPDFEIVSKSRENGVVTITYTSELDLENTEITGNSSDAVLGSDQKTITFEADEADNVTVVAHSVAADWTKTVSFTNGTEPEATEEPAVTQTPSATDVPSATEEPGGITVPDTRIFSYEQSFATYPSAADITAEGEVNKWTLGGFSVGGNDCLTMSNDSTTGGLNTARFYLDRNAAENYYTENTTVEFSADFKVDAITYGTKGFVGFNFMNGTSTQTTLFLLGSNGDDVVPHLYIPVSKDFNHDSAASNGYDAGTAALGEWVNVTVKINKEQISYYANGSYLASVDFTGKTPLDNAGIDNIALAARNTVSGGVKNFSYKVYNTGKTVDYLGYCDLAGGFRPNTTAVVSDGRLVFGSGDTVTADRTIVSSDMSGTDYNAALAFSSREHIIKFNATILADAQEGDHLDLYNADGETARMRMVSLVKNADDTYNILVNSSLSNDSGAAPSLSPGAGYENIACGADVNILVKISASESAQDANVITYYINGRETASVDRIGGKVSYGRYMKLEAAGGSDEIAAINNMQVYCYKADNKPAFDVAASERIGDTITISYTSEVDLGNTTINDEPVGNVTLSADQRTITLTAAVDEDVTVKAYTMAGGWTKTVSFMTDTDFEGTVENSNAVAADSPVVITYTDEVDRDEIYLNGLQTDAQVSEDGRTVTIAVPAGGFDTGIPYAVTVKSRNGKTAEVIFTTEGPQRELTAYYTSVTAETIGGEYTVSPALKVRNNLDVDQRIMVYTAEYSKGVLVGVNAAAVTVAANSEAPVTVSCELDDSTDQAEIFVWTTDMKPVLKHEFVISR